MIHCELCGGPLMVRPGGKEARCQNCGLLYPVEELKAMLAAAEGRPAKEPGEHYQGEPEAVWPEQHQTARKESRAKAPQTEQAWEPRPRTEEEEAALAYFDYLFRGAFPDLQIRRDVPAAELGGESWCVPVDFLLSRNGRNLLAVCICDQHRWKNKPIRGTEQAAQQAGIPFMRFIRQFSNRPEYVIPRVSRVLYPDGIYVPKTE